jgi:hypothetical protein
VIATPLNLTVQRFITKMQIQFKHKHQVKIADLLWEAQDEASVNLILKTFGHDARVVYNMMIASSMDQVTDTNLAEQALNKIFKE